MVVHLSQTRAAIESRPGGTVDIDGGGDVSVNAVSDVLNINIAGSFAVGSDGASSVGIGAAVAVVLRTTEAYIGDPSDDENREYEPGDATSPEASIGALSVTAKTTGGVYSFALAGSLGAGTGENAKAPTKSATPRGHRHAPAAGPAGG